MASTFSTVRRDCVEDAILSTPLRKRPSLNEVKMELRLSRSTESSRQRHVHYTKLTGESINTRIWAEQVSLVNRGRSDTIQKAKRGKTLCSRLAPSEYALIVSLQQERRQLPSNR